MTEPANPRRHRRRTWKAKPETIELLRVSGNSINGMGETTPRRAFPFFWHPPDQHPWGDVQLLARMNSRKCPRSTEAFQGAYTYPEPIAVAERRRDTNADELTKDLREFALAHEADDVGIAAIEPTYVFEDYSIEHPYVVILALAHNYERLREVPSDETNGVGVSDVGDQHARGTRSSYGLANWIRSQGYHADPYPGRMAGALLLIPPAIAAGLGELGKHGSLISPKFSSGLRLAGVTTYMALVPTGPIHFGPTSSAQHARFVRKRAHPVAIIPQKQIVRGVERFYVNFDKCTPSFAEAASCGICIAECPWTRPSARPKLLATMARRIAKE